MNITIQVPEGSTPSTMQEVLKALKQQKLDPSHDQKNWGDWIRMDGCDTVISIECNYGLANAATIEHSDDDSDEILPAIYKAFHAIGWVGMDDEGEYPLV